MSKSDLIALIQSQKDAKVAQVASDYDALLTAANSLDDVSPDVAALQAKLDAASAEIAKDVGTISADEASIVALQAKLDQIKSILSA